MILPEDPDERGESLNYQMTESAVELARQAIDRGKTVRWRVNGVSMRPLLRPGDQIVVVSATPQTIQRGDVVVIRQGRGVVTHRLVGRDRRGWYAKGDALRGIDPPFQPEALMGRVVARERNGASLAFDTWWMRSLGWLVAWYGWAASFPIRWKMRKRTR